MSTNKQALRIPEREKHDWGQAVMHTCDFCEQYAMTITREDGEHSCASCCDAEYATVLTCALEMAIDRAEAAEARIAELEARGVKLPQHYSMLHRDDFSEPYHTEMVYKLHQVLEALHEAGISVKGE